MSFYSYNYLLPRPLIDVIESTVTAFASERELAYHLWAKDLPAWSVSSSAGNRVDQALVESIVTNNGSMLIIVPDAFEDRSTPLNGMVKHIRSLASAEAVRDGQETLDTHALTERIQQGDADGVSQELQQCLASVLARARALPLGQTYTWDRPALTSAGPNEP